MSTNSINPASSAYTNYQATLNQQNSNSSPASSTASTPENSIANPVDTFTPSTPHITASRQNAVSGAANPNRVNELLRETNHQIDAVRRLINSALGNNDATGQGFWAQRLSNANISPADRAQAQSLISEDGFFGVAQTTDRIMGFATALIGEGASSEQIETMRAAVQRGFDDVARMFGGFDRLPAVTRDTHAAIMARFDELASAASGSAAASTATNTQ